MNEFAWVDEMQRKAQAVEAAGPYPCEQCSSVEAHMPHGLCTKCIAAGERRENLQRAHDQLERLPKWAAAWLAHPDGPRKAPDGRTLEAIVGKKHIADAVAALATLRSKAKLGLVLQGPTGAGKSTLAVHLAVRTMLEGRSAFWASATEIGTSRRDAGLGREPWVLEHAKASRLLILDDLGQEDAQGRIVVNELVHARYDDNRPSIVTTGFDQAWVAAQYGAQFARRVYENALVMTLGKRKAGAQ